MNDKKQINFAGGSPTAGYFLLLRQNKVTKEKASRSAKVCNKEAL
jgi:hypothetical protein